MFFLSDEVEVQAQPFALVVERNCTDIQCSLLVINCRVTLLDAAVETYAKLLLFTKATTDVQMATRLSVRGITGGESSQVLGQRSLGNNVDHAADTTVGRNPIHQSARTFEHLNPLGIFGEHVVIGGHAIDTIEGQLTQVAFAHGKAANEKGVHNAASLPRGAH